MTDWILQLLADLADTPALLFVAVFLLTFALEDAVAVAAGILAGRMAIDPVVTVAALVGGTVAGDLALHAAGRWLGETRFVTRFRAMGSGRVEAGLRRQGLLMIAVARFVPGTRLPVFLGSGVVRTPFLRSALVIAATTLLWTPGLFWLSFGAGAHVFAVLTPTTLLAAAALIGFVLLLPRMVRSLTPLALRPVRS